MKSKNTNLLAMMHCTIFSAFIYAIIGYLIGGITYSAIGLLFGLSTPFLGLCFVYLRSSDKKDAFPKNYWNEKQTAKEHDENLYKTKDLNWTWLTPYDLVNIMSDSAYDRVIAGAVDKEKNRVCLYRGDWSFIEAPFDSFQPCGNGIQPDFDEFEIIDQGYTLRFGKYTAAVDAVLYECDPSFRKMHAK